MSKLSLVSRSTSLLAIAALTFACGGTTEDGDGTAAGGNSASGGAATGGSTSSGGASSGGSVGSGGSGTGGGTIDRSCATGSDCVVLSESCCGTCGAPSLEDMTAVRLGSEAAYRDSVCDETAICPACAALPNPNLYAACEATTCVAKDLTREPASECVTDDDCRVRTAACCECGGGTGPGELIALNATQASDYLNAVCDPLVDCTECAPLYPEEATAVCDKGHCQLVDSRSPF